MAAFSDLNILHMENVSTKEKLLMAIKLGYEVVAINNYVENVLVKDDKGKSKKEPSKVKGASLKQLSRFTTVLSDPGQWRRMQEDDIQAYDLLAVQPTTEKLFHMACTAIEIDIITFNIGDKLTYYLKPAPVSKAIERGVHFEIVYSEGFHSSSRRTFIANALRIMHVTHGKNVIISSGAREAMDVRGPYDVANLGLLIGLQEPQSKDAISTNSRACVLHANTRHSVKSVISVRSSSELKAEDQWTVEACRKEASEESGDDSSESAAEEADSSFDAARPESKRRRMDGV
ncbi:PREDICTED: ribonuclease P protein subunit p30-like isoform X2 [Priapulus caudatus]|uniref:Ribonuclease P protein subunit p30-like isoform X2 n=1 Tax=Priapulus caudatus TaxID=37621 RepID=A0ABM1F4B4_PRICU|nr:PREDICTED: ribonuclease P protein subunit p30-like isoform X2 [Priapulus caudatus]